MIDNPPKTLEEAIDYLMGMLCDDDKKAIASCETDMEMIGLTHHGLGTWIRNNFGLWEGNDELVDGLKKHAGVNAFYVKGDDASAVILDELWKRLGEDHE